MAKSTLEFEYHPDAVAESTAAFHWYSSQSEEAADAFWSELRKARVAVSERPTTWPTYLHGTRCLKLDRFPYGLVYIERDNRIIGIAVAHLHRRPGYWRNRLP